MNNRLKIASFILAFITLPFLMTSCKDDKKDVIAIDAKALSITSIFPESGKPGSAITITGSDFGTDPSKVRVQFNRIIYASTIISVTDTQIKVEVPAGFSDQAVNVRVFVSDQTSNTILFYYLDTTPPSISSVTAKCFTGSTVVISGNNFSVEKEENIVKFGNVIARVIEAKKTALTVIAPDLGTAISANVTVTKDDMVSNARNIDVDVDQNKVATYDWTTHIVKPGVVYKTAQFPLFGASERRIHILDVTLNEANTLGIGFSTPNKSTVAISNGYGAVAGINGGYFPLGNTVDKDPYIRINGVTILDGDLGISDYFSNAALIIHNNIATVRKFTENHTNLNLVAAAIPPNQAENVIVCGPMLVTNGVLEKQNTGTSHNTSLTARTGLGVSADGKRVWMVVVDYGTATGVTTTQLGQILQALGAANAMNFDGGGSSTMFVQNRGTSGRVSSNGNIMRSVRDVIYVK